ncbi:MAG TPA: hypothetical protein VES38_05780 [Methylotenera sp.]|nr:hypothetical protein [Methylotenera sp.]
MKTIQLTTLLVLIGGLSACVDPAPRYEAEFGNATRATFNAQIINPDAGNNPNPVTGLDGRAASDAINNYQKSFAKPEPTTNVFNIGVGDNSNSGTGGK